MELQNEFQPQGEVISLTLGPLHSFLFFNKKEALWVCLTAQTPRKDTPAPVTYLAPE